MALEDGLLHEVPVLRLNVLSQHRMLHTSTCHLVTTTADPFADWRGNGNGLFTKVTKTWIYDTMTDSNVHKLSGNANPKMGWENIAFPSGCSY